MADGRRGVAGLSGTARVTVLVCTHNDEPTLARALDSALAQTASPEDYRVLVVDDGSTDATPGLLRAYEDRLESVRLDPNRGLVGACNEGLARIETPFYVRLDGDDSFEPELLQALLDEADGSGADLVYTDRWEVAPDGGRERRSLGPGPEIGLLIAAGVLMPTDLVRELGGYRPLFWEEYDLLMRLLESGRCRPAHVALPGYAYTVGADGMTSDADAVRAGWAELREVWPAEVLARYGIDRTEGVPGRD